MKGHPISSWFVGPFTSLGWWVAIMTFALDQTHKWWMLLIYGIDKKGRVTVTPFLDLVYVLNKGVSYSWLTMDSQSGQYALALFAALAVKCLAIWLATGVENKLMAVSLGLIMGGALGNALDRLLLGGVADFFSLHAFGFYWYVFNIADIAIVAGVVGLLYDSFVSSRTSVPKSPQNQATGVGTRGV
jgi:signal peptidase II